MEDNILIELNSEQLDVIIRGLNLLRLNTYEDLTTGLIRGTGLMQEHINFIDNLIYYLKYKLNINYNYDN